MLQTLPYIESICSHHSHSVVVSFSIVSFEICVDSSENFANVVNTCLFTLRHFDS